MPLTIDELKLGIEYWQESTNWPRDYHAAWYQTCLPAIQPTNGVFDRRWWDRCWPVLQHWRATRRGGGRALMTRRAEERFDALRTAWSEAVAPHLSQDIAELEWHQIERLPIIAAQIKNVGSPVFSSKLCHFLAPNIFPVVDNKAMGNPFRSYQDYFTTGRSEWFQTDHVTQRSLVEVLTLSVGRPLPAVFPLKCKLIELCMIGRKTL